MKRPLPRKPPDVRHDAPVTTTSTTSLTDGPSAEAYADVEAAPLSRRGLLGVGAGLLGAGAFGSLGVVGATSAEAAAVDPALHLLRRATYGATPQLLASLRKGGAPARAAWLEKQLTPGKVADRSMDILMRRWPRLRLSAKGVMDTVGNDEWAVMMDLVQAHIARACWSNRQLFEVMVDFWSNHLNVTCPSSEVWTTRHLYDQHVIRAHAFGKFSDMLLASARHPAMLAYLDQSSSDKDFPNENYAREVLELHTVGVNGGYTEAMVKSAARLLTGLSVDKDSQTYLYDTTKHATGPVRVLGFTHPNKASYGEPAAMTYLTYLAHHPATAKHVATKLAIRFVSDAPSPALVRRLANVYLQNDTQIKPVLRALFTSQEFLRASGAKVKRPFEDMVATVRALGIRPPATGIDGIEQLYWLSGDLGQAPMGWHPPNGYPDVAIAWQSAGGTLARWNTHLSLAAGWWPKDLRRPDLESLLGTTVPKTYGALVDQAAAGLGLAQPTRNVRGAISTFLGHSAAAPLKLGDEAFGWRLPYVFALLLDSPAAALR